MSDIQLVIKIPEEIITDIKDIGSVSIEDAKIILSAINDGTQLPKGHGPLFDERDIVNGNYEIIGNKIYDIEPIIEADAPKRRKGTPREDYEPLYDCEDWIP